MRKAIGRRGDTVAWADFPFDPETDDVWLHAPNQKPQRVMWQRALKFGYWVETDDRGNAVTDLDGNAV